MAVYLPLASALVQVASPESSVAAAVSTPKAQTTTTPAPAQTTAVIPVATAPQAATIYPNCTPSSFSLPTGLALDSAAVGLTMQQDNPAYYQIYGGTATALRTQIQRCAPGSNGSASAEFTGQTSYDLTWQYSTVNNGNCSLTDVKIGVHIATALPLWQPTSGAASGLPARWQSFASSLATHEQGHATLDKQYASKLLSDLNTVTNVDCGNLSSTVSNIVNADVGALNQANNAYDTATNHGATQGAILPTY